MISWSPEGPPSIAVGGTVTVNFPNADPEGTATAWELWAAGKSGSSGWCCFTGSSVGVTFNSAGVYRIGVQAIDRELSLSTRRTAVLQVGGAAGTPPTAAATLDRVSGEVPFSVNVDMSGSAAGPGSTIQSYFIGCGGGGFTAGSASATGTCTFTGPGTYWLLLQVQDNTGQMDLVSAYVVATPPSGGADTTPPTVAITAPANGTSVSGPVTISADASDGGGSGVARIEFRLDDAVSGALIGTDTTSPYSVTWDPSGTPAGSHTLFAIAFDGAGNEGTSPGVSITIPLPPPPPPAPPTVTISLSPTSPARKSTATITASPSTTSPQTITRVEFYINGSLVNTDTTSNPYSHTWKVPAASGKTYTLSAKAYDSAGGVGTSSTITVKP
jgi:hypothetical protein